MQIRNSNLDDLTSVLRLYQRVASVPGGLARLPHEISEPYIFSVLEKSMADGVALVATAMNGIVVGEVHASSSGLFCFSHVLTDVTVAVDPDYRRQGIARSLFESFFAEIAKRLPHISRVELISRESNTAAIHFYEQLGFVREGRLEGRIKNMDGSFEADIPMGWNRTSPTR